MSHNGDGDDEYPAGVGRSNQEWGSCSAQAAAHPGQPSPYYMGGLGATLPSPPGLQWQRAPPLNYPHEPQYALHRPQPQPQ